MNEIKNSLLQIKHIAAGFEKIKNSRPFERVNAPGDLIEIIGAVADQGAQGRQSVGYLTRRDAPLSDKSKGGFP